MLEGYEKEVKRLKEHIAKLSWYMRGGVTYEQLMQMCLSDISRFTDNSLSKRSHRGLARRDRRARPSMGRRRPECRSERPFLVHLDAIQRHGRPVHWFTRPPRVGA